MKVNFRRILCATDLSEISNHAVHYAVAMAKRYEAQLYLCNIVDLPMVTVHGAAYTYPEDYVENLKKEILQSLNSLIGQPDVPFEPIVTTGPVAATIASLADDYEIDLAVVATHGRSGFKRLIIGSVTERLIRTTPCPLLIVPPPADGANAGTIREKGFKSIMVGCDFSADSNSALQYAFSLAQEFESILHLVHVIEPVTYRDVLLPEGLLEEVQNRLNPQLGEMLETLVPDEARNWCEIKTTCLAGRTHDEITRYAQIQGVDLIVLGVRGKSLMETMLLGATTGRVIRRAVCPVLSVGPRQMED
jgi:nucleotide-binding universal stress UspA family protein